MFKSKYKISIIDSKWNKIKMDYKVEHIPNKNELILLDEKYYEIINIIHRLNFKTNKTDIFLVINEFIQNKKD